MTTEKYANLLNFTSLQFNINKYIINKYSTCVELNEFYKSSVHLIQRKCCICVVYRFIRHRRLVTLLSHVSRSPSHGKCLRDGKPFDDETVSPVVRQTLQHWAYQLTATDFEKGAKKVRRNGAAYVPRTQLAHVVAKAARPGIYPGWHITHGTQNARTHARAHTHTKAGTHTRAHAHTPNISPIYECINFLPPPLGQPKDKTIDQPHPGVKKMKTAGEASIF